MTFASEGSEDYPKMPLTTKNEEAKRIAIMKSIKMLVLMLVALMFGVISVQAQRVMLIHYKCVGIYDPAPFDEYADPCYTEYVEKPTVSFFQEVWDGTSLYPKLVPLSASTGMFLSYTLSTPYLPTIPRQIDATAWEASGKFWASYTFNPLRVYGKFIVRIDLAKPYANALSSPNNLNITPFGLYITDFFGMSNFVPVFPERGKTQMEIKIEVSPYGYTIK